MPYVNKLNRYHFEPLMNKLRKHQPYNTGELNFLVTSICLSYLEARRKSGNGQNQYSHFNDVIGALECAKMEFYRRAVVPYETIKIRDNGDIYPKEKK